MGGEGKARHGHWTKRFYEVFNATTAFSAMLCIAVTAILSTAPSLCHIEMGYYSFIGLTTKYA